MSYTQNNTNLQKGFTLAEILIAAGLVVILGAIIAFSTRGILERNRKSATRASLKTIKASVEQYSDDTGEYPRALIDLVVKPTDEKVSTSWEGPYISGKKAPVDGWKQPFVYNVTEGSEHPFELYSYGPGKKGAPKSEWIDAWNL